MKSIDQKLAELEVMKAELLKEKERIESLSSEQQLAEYMHEKLCRWNHTDGCSWYYENDWHGDSHQKYLAAAARLYYIVNYAKDDKLFTCRNIVNIMKDI